MYAANAESFWTDVEGRSCRSVNRSEGVHILKESVRFSVSTFNLGMPAAAFSHSHFSFACMGDVDQEW
jgi:hypothetical protein